MARPKKDYPKVEEFTPGADAGAASEADAGTAAGDGDGEPGALTEQEREAVEKIMDEKRQAEAPPTEKQKIERALDRELPKTAPKADNAVAWYNCTLNEITLNGASYLEPYAKHFSLPPIPTEPAAPVVPCMIPKMRSDMLLKKQIVQKWIGAGIISVGRPPQSAKRAVCEPKPTGELAEALVQGKEIAHSGDRTAVLASKTVSYH